MKKQYIKPQAEMWFLESQTIMRASGHDNNMPEAKEQQTFEEDKAADQLNIQFKDIWADEE